MPVTTSTPTPEPGRPAQLDIVNVTKTEDTGDGTCDADCSLREAVASARAGATIHLPAGVYNLSNRILVINTSLTLAGAGAEVTFLQPAKTPDESTSPVIEIQRGNNVTISGVTVRHGREANYGGGISNDGVLNLVESFVRDNAAANGGGIYNNGDLRITGSQILRNVAKEDGGGISNDGTLTLKNTTVTKNKSRVGGGILNNGVVTVSGSVISENVVGLNGGGIHSRGELVVTGSTISGNRTHNQGGGIDNNGKIVVTGSTISGNTARQGGGIFHTKRLTMTDSTMSSNTATEDGGAIYSRDGGVVVLANSTLSGNRARHKGGGVFNPHSGVLILTNVTIRANTTGTDGGGIYNEGEVKLVNTIIAGNSVDRKGPDCYGSLTSRGHNLIGDISGCGLNAIQGDLVGASGQPVDPMVGPLQVNGGSLLTHALSAGSPAIDAGDDASCPATDQRGIARPQGLACDIGAYER